MTLLQLIYGDRVQPTPGRKILKADEVSKLIDAGELIEEIRQEAERFKEEVSNEGFETGQAKWAEQIALLEEARAAVREEMHGQLTKLALAAAKKIVGREIEINPETVADIVTKSLRSVSGDKRVTIYCNRADVDALEKYREKLQSVFERLESLSIQVRDDIEEKGCIIETERGIIDARPETLWGALEEALSRLLS